MPEMLRISAPGKVCIAGEWAVLEGLCPSLLSAVPKRTVLDLYPWRAPPGTVGEGGIVLDGKPHSAEALLPLARTLAAQSGHAKFIQMAAALFSAAYGGFPPCTIVVRMLPMCAGVKLGIGSSAAVTVAALAGLFAHHKLVAPGRETIDEHDQHFIALHRLAHLTHWLLQGCRGSGADVAACLYGGIIEYQPPDQSEWESAATGGQLPKLLGEPWSGFTVKRCTAESMRLLVGWSGEPAHTPALLNRMADFKRSAPSAYGATMESVAAAASQLIAAFNEGNIRASIQAMQGHQRALVMLADRSGVSLVTRTLSRLIAAAESVGGAGKIAGAGGGDCGIALVTELSAERQVLEQWQRCGVIHLPSSSTTGGIRLCLMKPEMNRG